MPDVIGIGSTFVDYFFEADKNFLKEYELHPEDDVLFEEKNITPQEISNKLKLLAKSAGGMSTNTIAVMSALGIKTGFYAVVGKDENGKIWKSNLQKVETSCVELIGEQSVCFCILTSKRRKRLFLSYLNSKDNSFFRKINYKYLNSAKIVHVSPFLLDSEKTLFKLSRVLKKINKPQISFSPSLVYCRFGINILKPIFKNVDILFFNKFELETLTRQSYVEGSKNLLKFGPKIIVCTLGENGVLITTGEEQVTVKTKSVKRIVDSTGAGDAFAAGFLYGILKEKTVEQSAGIGNEVARKALSAFGLSWLNKTFKSVD